MQSEKAQRHQALVDLVKPLIKVVVINKAGKMIELRFFYVEDYLGILRVKELDAEDKKIYESLCRAIAERNTTKFSALQNSSEIWKRFINKTIFVRSEEMTSFTNKIIALNLCHLAAINHCKDVLKELLQNGGDLSRRCVEVEETCNSKKFTMKESVFDLVMCYFHEPADFFRMLLDESVECNDLGSSYEYTFDFAILQPSMSSHEETVGGKNLGRKMTVLNAILNSTDNVHSQQYELLKHPLIEAYLTCQWKHYRRFFFLLVALHMSFVLCLSTAVILIVKSFQWFHNQSVIMLLAGNFTHVNEVPNSDGDDLAHSFVLTMRSICLLDSLALVCAVLLLVHAIIQATFIPLKKLICEFEIILNLITAPCSIVKCMLVILMPYEWYFNSSNRWIYHLSSFIILPAWINLMLIVGRFPRLGCYSLMFTTVLQNFLKVMTSFVFLIVGFALSFSLVFPKSEFFNNPLQSILRTVVMMVGEFDYVTTFSEEQDVFLSGTSRVIFLFFIISCSIILMNLTQGIAVNDIKLLHEISQVIRLEKETRFLYELECVFCHSLFISHPFLRKIKKKLYDRDLSTSEMRVTRYSREGISNEVYEKLVANFKPSKCSWNRRMSHIYYCPRK